MESFQVCTPDLEHYNYLAYFLKPNNYRSQDWRWLIEKFEKRIKNWTYRFLSIGGRLTLVTVVLLRIPVYWFSILQVPSFVVNLLRRFIFNFLWTEGPKSGKLIMIGWEKLSLPKDWGGWGIKNLYWFNVALRMKSFWRDWQEIPSGKLSWKENTWIWT